jgi:hypothetical protein
MFLVSKGPKVELDLQVFKVLQVLKDHKVVVVLQV